MTPSRTRTIVIAGVLSAIAILLGVTHLGYIPWGVASLTIMHVPVIIGAVLEGPWVGALIGLIFGVTSLIQAAAAPTGPVDVFFTNPLVSVLPRLLIGPAAWLAWRALVGLGGLLGRSSEAQSRTLPQAFSLAGLLAAGAVGSLTNTVLVLSMLALATALPWVDVMPIVIANGIPELIISAVLVLAVVAAWWQLDTGRKGSDL